jgi:hypothetical protein
MSEAVARLAAALNDPIRSRIGNPLTNTWAVSFPVRSEEELAQLKLDLDQLEIAYQVNRPRQPGASSVAFVAIYSLEDQRRLLTLLEGDLVEARRKALDLLVRARGPIPQEIVAQMIATIDAGKSYAYVANKMNELEIIEGRKSGMWTAKKVKKALANA